MKKLLEKQFVFNAVLWLLAPFARRKAFTGFTLGALQQMAKLNLSLNRPKQGKTPSELAQIWQELMPANGKEYFPIEQVDEETAYTEIHLHCPLRGSGDTEACYRMMQYDRSLMQATGGELIVLESQANSGKSYCRLAIRPKGADTSDLRPAHQES
ncbi:MAG: hypothetical protein AAFQ68_20335 [Bacteroidota bacterium]